MPDACEQPERLPEWCVELGVAQRLGVVFDGSVAKDSSNAAEYLAKAVCHLYRVTPRAVHSVEAVCNDLERERPELRGDSLVTSLRDLNGATQKGNIGVYEDDLELLQGTLDLLPEAF